MPIDMIVQRFFDELFPCEVTAGGGVAVGFVDPLRQVVVGNFEIGGGVATGAVG